VVITVKESCPRPRRIRVIWGDASRLNCELIAKQFKENKSNVDVIASATDSSQLLTLVSGVAADVIVTHTRLRDGSHGAYRVMRKLRNLHPKIRTIVLINSTDRQEVIEAFRNGAHGVVSGDDSFETVCKCIEAVMRGEVWASRKELYYVLEALSAPAASRMTVVEESNRLTKREEEVVQLVAEALTNREISEKLMLTQNTVRNYLFRIFDKTGVSSRTELVLRTLNRGETQ
jgi:two-component system, NarL family, nitrate/nitrite response regulator NarL